MHLRCALLSLFFVACFPRGARPLDLDNRTHCTEDHGTLDRVTLSVLLRDPDGRPPAQAVVRVDPCCAADGGECPPASIDGEGRAVLEACPPPSAPDVIVSVETNPRFYTYTPPRSVRACARLVPLTIELQPHPPAGR